MQSRQTGDSMNGSPVCVKRAVKGKPFTFLGHHYGRCINKKMALAVFYVSEKTLNSLITLPPIA